MDYLKKDIFYPSTGKYDEKLIQFQYNKYKEYLNTIKTTLPKSLIKVYEATEWFHDYCIKRISVFGAFKYYSLKGDIIRLELCLLKNEVYIDFFDVSYLKILNENKDSCWVENLNGEPSGKSVIRGIEEIVLCEIGIISEGVFKFEFLTSNCAIFETHFKKVKIKILNRMY